MKNKKLFYILGIIVAVVILVEGIFFLIDGRIWRPITEYNTDGVIRSNNLNDKPVNTSSSTPFFPVANKPSEDSMTALLEGELALDNGCLRVSDRGYDNYLLVWPYGFSLNTDENGVIQVRDDKGQPVARVGDKVKIGGGECVKPCKGISNYSAQLPSDICSGPYWIVGEVVNR